MNPLFQAMGGNGLMQAVRQIKANPVQYLLGRYNVPQNIMNDPNAITQHLLSTGQVTQEQVNAAFQKARQLR